MAELDLSADVGRLTADVVDIESVSGHEADLADAVERALDVVAHLEVTRLANTLVARTDLGHDERVVVAGHLDTVPAADNLPSSWVDQRLYGLGACDMKGGVAVALRLAANLPRPNRDISYVFYECEEVEADRSGLAHLQRVRPDLLTADFAVLMEPSNAAVEAGCQGTLRAEVVLHGRRSHSARSWMGKNAIHAATPVLERLASYQPRKVEIDGLAYYEGLNAVGIGGGVAGNVIPDECRVSVNYRFAPDRSRQDAEAHVREVFAGFEIEVRDVAGGALPGLARPAASAFLAAVGSEARAKFGWTDVARFAEQGVPAVNYGPGDSLLAHTKDEFVQLGQLTECEERMRVWLGAAGTRRMDPSH